MTSLLTPHKIAVRYKEDYTDPKAERVQNVIEKFFHLTIGRIQIVDVYEIHKDLTPDEIQQVIEYPLHDKVIQTSSQGHPDIPFNFGVEISFKDGVTDNLAATAKTAIQDHLDILFSSEERVKTYRRYYFTGSLSEKEGLRIARELLANPLIEDIALFYPERSEVEVIDIDRTDEELEQLSRERLLALNLEEMKAVRQYYSSEEKEIDRASLHLPNQPTDVELEAIAQTWSEHCKHKIFNATIHYDDGESRRTIQSLFQTCIKKATDRIGENIDWLVSVFSDNAGIISFNEDYNLAFKVETHNSPSALDPYGGAMTGILGVNRDIMGAGIGARLLANTDVFCFAPPEYEGEVPERLLHPKRIFEGVRLGVEHGGNKSGVPTVNGAILFDERYLGKPLVYCGTAGIMPKEINGVKTDVKRICPDDLIVVAGGRTGKDGIHGATFSSEELHKESPSSAVQIGDPFTQKKLHDFLIEARDLGLYRAITDNGAGGLSSSVGEMSQLSGGCEIHLDRVPLKYPGLKPWEILLSESQERMTLAVDPEKLEALQELASLHEVEIASIGQFTNSSYFHVLFDNQTVAFLSLSFLHEEVPTLELEAKWNPPQEKPFETESDSPQDDLHRLLSRGNICSKEEVIRQYDHEVQGISALKPCTGVENDGPSDAAVIRPYEAIRDPERQKKAVILSNGICPRYSDIDTYHMAANAVDEAVRNCVAVGGNPDRIAILDNFCWPDPIYHPVKTPDGKHKLAQLVRANQALYDAATRYGTPIISGKDSMKNDYKIGDKKISVPPTLLISAIGVIDDVEKVVSMDFKNAGDLIYIAGTTRSELGCSEYALMKEAHGGHVPKVDFSSAIILYRQIYEAIQSDLLRSCHDCSEGGIAVALAESAFASNSGVEVHLGPIPCNGSLSDQERLFSESPSRFVLSVAPENQQAFEEKVQGSKVAFIGKVADNQNFLIYGLKEKPLIVEDISNLKRSFKSGVDL